MTRKVGIRVLDALSPRVEAVRRRLGGRAVSDPGIGGLVRLKGAPEVVGVVLWKKGDEVHVMTDATLVRKTSRDSLEPLPPGHAKAESLAAASADARVFAQLGEGDRVRYVEADGRLLEATLVEKCRYGGIVVRDDEALMGVGFRKIWPASPDAPS
jgi:hypothetical protein